MFSPTDDESTWDRLPTAPFPETESQKIIGAILNARSKGHTQIVFPGGLPREAIIKLKQKNYTVTPTPKPSGGCDCWGKCFCAGVKETLISWAE